MTTVADSTLTPRETRETVTSEGPGPTLACVGLSAQPNRRGHQRQQSLKPDFKVELFRRVIAEESLVRLDVVEELAQGLCSTLEVEQIFRLLAEQLPQLVDYSHLCLALRRDERGGYVVEHSVAQDDYRAVPVGMLVPPWRLGIRAPAETGTPVCQRLSEPTDDDTAPWSGAGIRSRVTIPLVLKQECLGLLLLASPEPGAFVPEEVQFLESVARYLAIALRNALLYQQSQQALAELRETQHQLIQMERQRTLGEMAAGIAHDLNNSLCGIVGMAELAACLTVDARLLELLDKLRTAGMEAAETVSRINQFGRQKSGPEEFVATDLQHLTEGTVMLTRYHWKNMAEMRGRQIETRTQFDHPAPVLGKPNELREVLTNLILNAVDAMPGGGTITLRTFCENGQACLSVTDTGVGISPEQQEKIFDRHFTTKGDAGSGVGLSISREIVRAHGGELTVTSTPGQGATFTLRLPLHDRSRAPRLQARTTVKPGTSPLRILLIEDERKVRDILTLLLQRQGHQVTTAETGRNGLELFRQSTFDLVLTDLGLPDGAGEDVVRSLRQVSPTTPVIVVTGWQGALDEYEVHRWGVSHVLYKPVSGEDLRAVITRLRSGGGGFMSEDSPRVGGFDT